MTLQGVVSVFQGFWHTDGCAGGVQSRYSLTERALSLVLAGELGAVPLLVTEKQDLTVYPSNSVTWNV